MYRPVRVVSSKLLDCPRVPASCWSKSANVTGSALCCVHCEHTLCLAGGLWLHRHVHLHCLLPWLRCTKLAHWHRSTVQGVQGLLCCTVSYTVDFSVCRWLCAYVGTVNVNLQYVCWLTYGVGWKVLLVEGPNLCCVVFLRYRMHCTFHMVYCRDDSIDSTKWFTMDRYWCFDHIPWPSSEYNKTNLMDKKESAI